MDSISCMTCGKKCTISDSRPYPNSTCTSRMHNRCILKAKLSKPSPNARISIESSKEPNKQPCAESDKAVIVDSRTSLTETSQKSSGSTTLCPVRTTEEKVDKNRRTLEKILAKEKQNDNQFFFDLKAGIAKPHEKRTFLYHKKLQDMKVSYDDNCFKADSVGRSFDHRGKDLNNPSSDSSEDSDVNSDEESRRSTKSHANLKHDSFESNRKRQRIELEHDDEDRSNKNHSHNLRKDGNYNNNNRGNIQHKDQQRARNNQGQDGDQGPCWFCLSSPKVEKHLIIAIGDHCYLALAKGGLTDDHLLIVPIQHMRSTNDIESQEMLDEISKFKESLLKLFASQSKAVIFYERNFRSTHLQIQVVPISLELLDGLETKIKSMSEKFYAQISYQLLPNNCSISDIIPKNHSYFLWEIEPLGVKFCSKIDTRGPFFPMQFGRKILAHEELLNLPNRIDWKKCSQTEEQCKDLVRQLKIVYKPYDFTLL